MKFNKKRLFAALALAGIFVSASCDTIETIQTSTIEVTSLSETTSETSYEISSEESSSTTSTTTTTSTSDPEAMKYSVNSLKNLSTDFFTIDNTFSEGNKFAEGSEVTITLTAGTYLSQGFLETSNHRDHVYVNINGKNYHPTFAADGQTESKKVIVKFIMPAEDIDVVACYSIQQHLKDDGHSVSLEENENVKLFGVDSSEKYDYINAYFVTKEGFKVSSVEYKFSDGDWTTIDEYANSGISYTKINEGVYEFAVRPNYSELTSDVTIRVNGELYDTYKISYNDDYSDYLIDSSTQLPTIGIEGDIVSVQLGVKGGVYVKEFNVLDDSGNSIEVFESYSYYTFTMPSSNVSISLVFAKDASITLVGNEYTNTLSVNSDFYVDPLNQTTSASPNESFYVFASCKEEYAVTKFIVNGVEYNASYYNGYFYACVYMPEDGTDAKITLETAKAYKFSTSTTEGIISLNYDIQTEGSSNGFSVYAPDGYKIDSVKLYDSNNQDVSSDVSLSFSGNYGSFTMPAYDVVLVVTYVEASQNTYNVIALYDENLFSVSDQTNWQDFPEELQDGSSFYLVVSSYDSETFYVKVSVGDSIVINEKIEADSETGEPGSFGRSINVTDDVLIEVSEEPFSNASQVNISVDGDTYTFIVTDNEWNTYTSEEVCSVDKDTMVSLSVSTYDYYDTYYVAITLDGKVIYNVEVNPDEETGEPGSKSFTFKASGDVVITISTEKIEVETVRTLTINVDTNVFEISDSNWNTYNSGDVIELTEESYYFTITTYDYYDTFYVTITVDGEVLYNTAVSPDEETGEPGSKSFLVGVTGDVVISVSTTSK